MAFASDFFTGEIERRSRYDVMHLSVSSLTGGGGSGIGWGF